LSTESVSAGLGTEAADPADARERDNKAIEASTGTRTKTNEEKVAESVAAAENKKRGRWGKRKTLIRKDIVSDGDSKGWKDEEWMRLFKAM
jgi:hypothetical protein